ncbi:RCKP-type rubredoxin-like domain-containing protein [Thermodesulfobacteriota bacterium]
MTVFQCEKCGATKEGRCKPKKCPACAETGAMSKKEPQTSKPKKK